MSEDQERRRIERLKRQQLNARDPGESKIPGYDWSKHAKKAKQVQIKKKQQSLVGELFDALPSRYKGVMIGLLLSILPAVIIYAATQGDFKVLALLPPLIFGVAGLILGAVVADKPLD